MILYHTSYTEIPHPDLQHSRPRLDFGIGFYLTPLRAQAERYGERFIRRGQKAIMNIYQFDDDSLDYDSCLNSGEVCNDKLAIIPSNKGGSYELGECVGYIIVKHLDSIVIAAADELSRLFEVGEVILREVLHLD